MTELTISNVTFTNQRKFVGLEWTWFENVVASYWSIPCLTRQQPPTVLGAVLSLLVRSPPCHLLSLVTGTSAHTEQPGYLTLGHFLIIHFMIPSSAARWFNERLAYLRTSLDCKSLIDGACKWILQVLFIKEVN